MYSYGGQLKMSFNWREIFSINNSLLEKKLKHWLKDDIIKSHGPSGGMATSQVSSWIFLVILVTCRWMIKHHANLMKHNATLQLWPNFVVIVFPTYYNFVSALPIMQLMVYKMDICDKKIGLN
jgi:hypothetical protein